MGSWVANLFLLIGAMEINISLVSVSIFRFLALKPQYPCEYQILIDLIRRVPFSNCFSPLEDRSLRSLGSILFANSKATKWSLVGSFFGSQSELGGRGGKLHDEFAILIEPNPLVGHGDM